MKKIVAIGGGEIGRPGFKIETKKIDQEIIKLTGKKHPRLLFLPTASNDSESYFATVKKYFGNKLGCVVDVLYLVKNKSSPKEIKSKILSADIIYVGGGNTLKMMKVWKKLGVDKVLQVAHKKGAVLSGLSAGAICWFEAGHSDSVKSRNPEILYGKVKGLDFVPVIFCPHYDFEKDRCADLKRMMKSNKGVAIAVDNCAAIQIVGDQYRIISSKPTANAYKVFWQNGEYCQTVIKKKKVWLPLKQLLLKQT